MIILGVGPGLTVTSQVVLTKVIQVASPCMAGIPSSRLLTGGLGRVEQNSKHAMNSLLFDREYTNNFLTSSAVWELEKSSRTRKLSRK